MIRGTAPSVLARRCSVPKLDNLFPDASHPSVSAAALPVVQWRRLIPAQEDHPVEKIKCPSCGTETAADAACPSCGHAVRNGAVAGPTPPEVAGWVIERPSREMLEEARRTFDEAEYLAAVREIERTGGVQIDDLIAELERRVNGSA
jgi:hypothetical protein